MLNAFAVIPEKSRTRFRQGVGCAALALLSALSPLTDAADAAVVPDAAGIQTASTAAAAAAVAQPGTAPSAADDTFLLTIFLRHDESKPLPQINDQLRAQGFFKTFPPPGIEVVSWYVMMGIGQVVTLRVPASRLREVNRAIETTAWGGYRTEFYPTYDYKSQAQQMRATDGK